MTTEEKLKVKKMRDDGLGYLAISKELNINLSTIKSFCRRKLNGNPEVVIVEHDDNHCLNCGRKLEDKFTPRKRKFCCDDCRQTYWNSHRELVKRKNGRTVTCQHCHKEFIVYGNNERKYCSINCFMEERFRNGKVYNFDDNIKRVKG